MAEEKRSSFTIRNWAESERPREKLLQKGRTALTDAELLAILIGSGSAKESAVDLCKRILADSKGLNQLGKTSITELLKYNGIGEAKAITIIAALELGRRRRIEEAVEKKKITSSSSVFEFLQPKLGELPHEEFYVLYLNNSNRILEDMQLSKGGITGTLVDVRLALKKAIEIGATSIILAHNHPSGNLTPSSADKQLTQKLKTASESLDIKVLDHIIITENSFFSFADEGIL